MDKKYKVLFNILNQYLLKSKCESFGIDTDQEFDIWQDDRFYCHKQGDGSSIINPPIPIKREISEYVEEMVKDGDFYYSDTGEEFYSFEFEIKPQEKVVNVYGIYTIYETEDGEEKVFENTDEPDVFDPIFDYLRDQGSDIIEVGVDAGGDSGWVHDEARDVNGKTIKVSEEMQDLCYRLLSDKPGWEINEGSLTHFTFDPHRNILVWYFAYHTEEQGREHISKETF